MNLSADKLQHKRTLLIDRTAKALGVDEPEAIRLLSIERRQSIRINTLIASVEQMQENLQQEGIATTRISWIDEGLNIEAGQERVAKSSLSTTGAVYIQNTASWLPVLALQPQADENILDMCAAPGGKTSHIAQRTANKAVLTANDNSYPRLHKLQNNLKRLNIEGVTCTLHDATKLARIFELESFDKILLDAPCSGEGMMTLANKKDFESWSVAHIKRLQQLQKKLIVQAWQLLKPGGRLVYSTCTMAPEENEAVIDYLLRHNDNVSIEDLSWLSAELDNRVQPVLQWNSKTYNSNIAQAVRLIPSVEAEAFFVIALTKTV